MNTSGAPELEKDMNPTEIPAGNTGTELHPLAPFLPSGARILMLGSFPPKHERWSMEFFYPNFNNDMWRIMGLIFSGDRRHFEISGQKRFDRERIMQFCMEKGIALYDSASEVRRLKDNASDKFLEIVTPTDISALLTALPECRAIVTTGEKATEAVAAHFGCPMPPTGGHTDVSFAPSGQDNITFPENAVSDTRHITFYRMPSSSRAYPLSLEKKAEAYGKMFMSEGII